MSDFNEEIAKVKAELFDLLRHIEQALGLKQQKLQRLNELETAAAQAEPAKS